MIFFLILCIIFLLMLLFPIGLGLASRKTETKALFIKKSNAKDPRYFAIAFKKIFNRAWKAYKGYGIICMSQEEKVIEADKVELLPHEICTSLVYAEKKDFVPNEGIVFEKEIYAKLNAYLKKIPIIRAIACEKNLVLGPNIQIIRWADSEGKVTVYNNCDLGISTTSATKLFIGENCSFKRLYAPEICLGIKESELGKDVIFSKIDEKDVVIFPEFIRNIEYVDDDLVNKNGILQNTIITSTDLTVLSNFVVQGHIKSEKDVKIDDCAIVHGNIFAEGNIFIGMNARVLGVVFSQENIYVDDGAVIGQPGKIKSVVARGNISFGYNCRAYGYIGSEGVGTICPNY